MAELTKNQFRTLLNLDVSEECDKDYKGLVYLSWASAYQIMMENDPTASYEVKIAEDGIPLFTRGNVNFVKTSVTMYGVTKDMWLPVMDNRHNAVAEPDSRQVSDNIMRCLVKNIAMFGIGLRVFKGETFQEIGITDVQKSHIAKLMGELSVSKEEISDLCDEMFGKEGVRSLYKDEANELISHFKSLRRLEREKTSKEVTAEQPELTPEPTKDSTVVQEDVVENTPVEEVKESQPAKRAKKQPTPVVEIKDEEPTQAEDVAVEESTSPITAEQFAAMQKLYMDKAISKEQFAQIVRKVNPTAKNPKQLTSEQAEQVINELDAL